MSTVTDLASYQKFALEQQAANNEWSAKQAQKQMDFQKMMSDTAHQREVADLKAAGLNPVLAAGGQGASVTSGAMADTDTSASANVGAMLQQVLQAQSAREVAAMYNAATLQAAMIAAETQREYPNTLQGVLAKGISDLQHNPGKVVNKFIAGLTGKGSSSAVKSVASRFASQNGLVNKRVSQLSPAARNKWLSYLKTHNIKNPSLSTFLSWFKTALTK